jgi:SNF2 family DNA or RNA helicase
MDDRWVVKAEAHVILRMKRVFAQLAANYNDHVQLSDTPDIARDLVWLMTRYELKITKRDKAHLERRVGEFEQRRTLVEDFINGMIKARPFELAEPARDYQVVAAELMLKQKALLLGDDMGVGKTVTGICVLTDPSTRPALVVVPKSLQRQWMANFARFAPELKTHLLKAKTAYDLRDDAHAFPDVIVTTYAKLAGWRETFLGLIKLVLFDECQELRHGTKTQKGAAATAIAHAADYRMGLSGTPIYNLGGEFFWVLEVLFPGALGTRNEFLIEWCGQVDARGRSKLRDPAAFGDHIRRAGLFVRRTRKDVGRELPPLTRIVVPVDSDTKVFEKIENDAMRLARLIVNQTGAPLERMQNSQDFSVMLRHATGVAKAPFVAEFVNLLLESENKIVVFAWHHDVHNILRMRLAKHEVVMYTGETSDAQRIKSEEAFMRGSARVLIMSLRAAAGFDGLQFVSRTVVLAELDYSPGVHEQDITRVFRDGQTEPVAAYFPLADEGSDPIIADMLQIKRSQIEGVRTPGMDIVESLEADGSRIRKLAEAYLKKQMKNRKKAS